MTVRCSVVMAAFNASAYIGVAIESILNQSAEDFELIIVDDCSTDTTRDIIQSYKDDRIRLIVNTENIGSGASRNKALSVARGPFIAIQDADDRSLPRRLETQLAVFAADASGGRLAVVASQLLEFGDWGGPQLSGWPTEPELIAQRARSMQMPVPHPSAMLRLEAVQRVGGYDPACRRAQDFALMLKLRNEGMATLPEALVMYRTERPLPLGYAIASGQYGLLARLRVIENRQISTLEELRYKQKVVTNLKSTCGWALRRISESRTL